MHIFRSIICSYEQLKFTFRYKTITPYSIYIQSDVYVYAPCPEHSCWLLCWRVVPPPQSDHNKQLLTGESTHPIRYKQGHFVVQSFIHTYIMVPSTVYTWYWQPIGIAKDPEIDGYNSSYVCGSVSAYPCAPGLDVCPPVEKDLDGPEVAHPSKIVQCGVPTLLEIWRYSKQLTTGTT